MKELVEHIVKAVVKHPDDVVVVEFDEQNEKVYEVVVNPEDVGQVIGKDGRTIKAITDMVATLTGRRGVSVRVVR
ncbi:MAG: KH domain-containing protein [Thermotogae bacterium]|nr:KH domain-containing protein [Thermotogota bacterium]